MDFWTFFDFWGLAKISVFLVKTGTGGTGTETGTGGTGTGKNEHFGQPQKIKKIQKSIQNQKITSPHHPKSKNNIAPPRQKGRVGAPWGPRGPPSLFGGVGRCYSLILDGGGMLFFDFGWIFGLFLIFGGWPKSSFFPNPVPPVPVRCPVPPVPVPNLTVLRFPVRFASLLICFDFLEEF